MNKGKFTKYFDKNRKYRFNLKAENSEIILHSEAYESSQGCDNGISSVRKNSVIDSRYQDRTASNGQFYFVLKARNGEIIGTSELYTSTSARTNGKAAVKRVAPNAPVEDNTLVNSMI
jgi:Uncharacterized conserved protein